MSDQLQLPGTGPASFIVALSDVRQRLDVIEQRLELLSESVEGLIITLEEITRRRSA